MRARHLLSVAVFVGALMGIAVAQKLAAPEWIGPGAGTEPVPVITGRLKDQTLASDLIGATAYSRGGRELGTIRDLLLNETGQVAGFVIGMGGLFGIGGKALAVSFAQAEIVKDHDGGMSGVRIDLSLTEADAAPPFSGAVGAAGAVSAARHLVPPAAAADPRRAM